MTRRMLTLAPLALLATAAGSGVIDLKNASSEQVVAAYANAQKERPGRYFGTNKVVAVDVTGVAPAMKPLVDQITKPMIGKLKSFDVCLTAEGVKRPVFEDFNTAGSTCRYARYRQKGSAVDVEMRCTAPNDPNEKTITATGQITAEKSAFDLVASQVGPMPGSQLRIHSHYENSRAGECQPQ